MVFQCMCFVTVKHLTCYSSREKVNVILINQLRRGLVMINLEWN